MKKLASFAMISFFGVVVSLTLVSNVQSQDLFREMADLKSEMAKLRNELNDTRNLVLELRKAMLEYAVASDLERPAATAPEKKEGAKPEPPVDEKELTKVICQAVGKFFSEAEAALRSPDPSTAESEMDKAYRKLTSTLHSYSRTHRVSKLLNIYEGLAWSTYTAVRLRGSVAGNEDFLQKLRTHKQRYIDTCPKE
ncbi:MAG: hypothetical protein AB1733_09020 [Thermodesulfobacteriota bacterium]